MTASYTLTQAAEVTGKSRVTIRRYLDGCRFPGAFRDEGPEGPGPWRIPATDLIAAGLTVSADTAASPPDDTGHAETGDLRTRLAVAEAIAEERARTIELLTEQLATLHATLRSALAGR